MNEQYRMGVGGVIFNSKKQIFMAQRIIGVSRTLQMPQGGLDEGEKAEDGIMREIYEETGIRNVTIIKAASEKYRYSFPKRVQKNMYNGKYAGQEQTWFLLSFHGDDNDIDLCTTNHQEFVAWKWVDIEKMPKFAVKFKRKMYASILKEFRNDIMNYS